MTFSDFRMIGFDDSPSVCELIVGGHELIFRFIGNVSGCEYRFDLSKRSKLKKSERDLMDEVLTYGEFIEFHESIR